MPNTIDKKSIDIKSVKLVNELHNPEMRSEKEGYMACKFLESITINEKPYFLDVAFIFSTNGVWLFDKVTSVNTFNAYETIGGLHKECLFTDEQIIKIVDALAAQMTYDEYRWFTKKISK